MRVLKILGCLLLFGAGFACGAMSFVRTQARPLVGLRACFSTEDCMANPELLALLASVGLRLAPGAMPDIVARSPQCVGIRNPRPEARIDLVFFPTRDMRNLLDVAADDEPYLMGCLALMRKVAEERQLKSWRIFSNGPGMQEIAYLHLHLVED